MVNVGEKHESKCFKGTDPNAINYAFLPRAKVNSFVFVTLKCKVEGGNILNRKYRIKAVE